MSLRSDGSEHVAQVGGDHAMLGERDRDLALALGDPAGVDDRDRDERAVGVELEVVPIGRRIVVGVPARLAGPEVENVVLSVVRDPVELDAGVVTVPRNLSITGTSVWGR
ncbi:MAG: hypothetical protein RMM28_07725 [Thermoleophilia bacterium]|nr:hypothetical protein [Thermoleophilia bacterium]